MIVDGETIRCCSRLHACGVRDERGPMMVFECTRCGEVVTEFDLYWAVNTPMLAHPPGWLDARLWN